MLSNLSKLLFLSTLILGTLMTISSKSWMIMWIGLEINLLSFIPFINSKNPLESESSMKYFLVQVMASMMIMVTILITDMLINNLTKVILLLSLFIKMGLPPFHLWFPSVMQGMLWYNCLLMMTWQKVAPMMMTSYLLTMNTFTSIMIMMSVMVGTIGGLNQTSVRKLMAYSSISHLGWMLLTILMSTWYWIMYFIMYMLINLAVLILLNMNSIYHVNQLYSMNMEYKYKFTLLLSVLSLGGLPPFLGFLPKWVVIQNALNLDCKMITMTLIMTTMITLYFYMRMAYSGFMLNNQMNQWIFENKNKSMIYLSMIISLSSIPLISIFNIY
uniref:NADH-ubiquinone oxidoreductase chain 2 n=1 Tax=Megaloprepus caerulatus TaxID=263994 RepID=A0A342ZZM7_9ODON|nr:NADH dehydrogenase subunit 2 [Megaloprepus caerulatus]AOW43828.1 NADH dehydrogenase subunit 2 [Megaloprepus caerulatus]